MGWRFRRSFKMAPGIRLNVSRRAIAGAFQRWARGHFPFLSRWARDAITGIRRAPVDRYDVTYQINQRRIAVRTSVVPRKTKPTGSWPDAATVDPWDSAATGRLQATQTIAYAWRSAEGSPQPSRERQTRQRKHPRVARRHKPALPTNGFGPETHPLP